MIFISRAWDTVMDKDMHITMVIPMVTDMEGKNKAGRVIIPINL